ncbi:MAG: helix-turn-helix domain-containing protein [Deltaproteobacteria bacterium]|nr:helix-turn-helix domain-containing protein [Deltaproteobacteria bacterium]
MKPLLSPRELAQAIGVSESSLKRWADAGQIRVARTAGGHRRISIADAVRFIRESRVPLVAPERLGLPGPGGRATPTLADAAELLFRHLAEGHGARASGLVMSLYLAGHSVAEICDGPIQQAMARIGELWRHGESGIYIEHRATDLCIQAAAQLRATFQAATEAAPCALGAAPSGDPYLLPSVFVASVAAEAGLRSINLGPDLPVAALAVAVREQAPALIWLSLSSQQAAERAAPALLEAGAGWTARGLRVIAGGHHRDVVVGQGGIEGAASMAELEVVARAVLAAEAAERQVP